MVTSWGEYVELSHRYRAYNSASVVPTSTGVPVNNLLCFPEQNHPIYAKYRIVLLTTSISETTTLAEITLEL